jgi:L-fuculose-phosphate aldolase
MKNVISLKDLEQMVRNGQSLNNLPADSILTPSAREFLQDQEMNPNVDARASAAKGPVAVPTKPLTSKSSKAELEAFFNSAYAHTLKEQLCDIGRRLWGRAYVDGNGGNIAIRVGEDIALCTPTLVSKGFMKPEAHERNPDALADYETAAESGGDVSLSSALQHGVRGGRASAADVHDSRI